MALFNVVKEVSLKSVKNKTWDLTSRTFRSNDAEPTNSKNYSIILILSRINVNLLERIHIILYSEYYSTIISVLRYFIHGE